MLRTGTGTGRRISTSVNNCVVNCLKCSFRPIRMPVTKLKNESKLLKGCAKDEESKRTRVTTDDRQVIEKTVLIVTRLQINRLS